MKWTSIPENLSGLSALDLRALADALKGDIRSNTEAATNQDELNEVKEYRAKRAFILSLAEQKEADDAEDAAAAQAAADEAAAAEAAAAEAAAAAQADPETGEGEGGEGEGEGEGADTEAAAKPGRVPAVMGAAAGTEVVTRRTPVGAASQWNRAERLGGGRFANFEEIGQGILDFCEGLTGNSDFKHVIAQAEARFAPGAQLADEAVLNLEKFEPEVMAAMCAPLQPLYDLACQNTTRRPVAASLPRFQSPTRGGFSVYASPSLADITTGYGQWTAADDANPAALKEACQEIECGDTVDYRIYGVYRCMTIKNLLQMTFPELVEAWLNRLAAAQARLAETLLLEAMGNNADTVDANAVGYNASTSITSGVLNFLALRVETERWDDEQMEAWIPRWLIRAMQADQVRRRRTDGGFKLVPSVDEILGQIRDTGVNPHVVIDRPSWMTPIPAVSTAGVLNHFPRNAEILVAPRGKFAMMDRGDLSIGVASGNLYRDNSSNQRNEFTLFFENFEGLIDTNTCPAHILQFNNLCYNGQQIADIAIDCEGDDDLGIGS